jgi:hypothetical protein
MSVEYYFFNSLLVPKQEEVADMVSAYTTGQLGEKPQMLPVKPAEIWKKHVGVVALEDEVFMGYIGATEPQQHNGLMMPEVGSLWVPKQHRNKGVAHGLISVVSRSLRELQNTPYAFCNPLSKPIFERSGYIEAAADSVPSSAFSACGPCPMKLDLGGCCDEVLVFVGEIA